MSCPENPGFAHDILICKSGRHSFPTFKQPATGYPRTDPFKY